MIISGKTLKHKYQDIVTPFVDHKEKAHGMSYGLSLGGYDIRIKEGLILNHQDFALGSSLERFKLPKNVMGFVHDKSSWARQGLSLFNTVIEPGWEGYLTLELVFLDFIRDGWGTIPLEIPAGCPIAQIIFMYTDEETEGYSGKYQNQEDKPVEFIFED